MKIRHMYQKIEIKRAMRILPQYYLGVLFLLLLFAVAAIGGRYLTKKEAKETNIRIAMVLNNNETISTIGMQLLGTSESTGSFCSFYSVEEEEAKSGLADGTYQGIVVFPDRFVSGVMQGKTEPATLYIPRFGNSFNNDMMEGLVSSAGSLLTTVEAGVACVYEAAAYVQENDVTKSRMEDDIRTLCATYLFAREQTFVTEIVTGTGDATAVQYYVCAAIVLLLLLGGISCGPLLKGDNTALEDQLRIHRIGTLWQLFGRYLAVCSLFLVFYTSIFAGLLLGLFIKPSLMESLLGLEDPNMVLIAFLGGLPVLLLAAAIVLFVYSLAANQISGILLLFLVTVLMGYASGCIAPAAFLPKSIRVFGGYLPTRHMLKTLLAAWMQMPSVGSSLLIGAETALALLLAALVQKGKEAIAQ